MFNIMKIWKFMQKSNL